MTLEYRESWVMGNGSHGSWVNWLMGHMGHGSKSVTHCHLWFCCANIFTYLNIVHKTHKSLKA